MYPENPPLQARVVSCPNCRGESLYAPSNPYRPFCSQRCKRMDLGAWADEGFRMPADTEPDEPPSPDTGLQ